MLNQINTLNDQYIGGYFDKDEYISRLSIDLVMDNERLLFSHEDIQKKDFEYDRKDLISENMHQQNLEETLEKFCNFEDVVKLRANYMNFLIETAGDYIERHLNLGYQVNINYTPRQTKF